MQMNTQRIGTVLAGLLSLPVLMTPAARADYASTVLADGPKAYYRLNDNSTRTLLNQNLGSLGAAGNATNDMASVSGGVVHPIPGAIVGDADTAEFFDLTTRTEIPFNAALNPPNTQPFTVEAWLYPVNDQDTTSYGGMAPLCNRWTQGGNRQGWVMYQRRPNADYSTPAEGIGWEFRMYDNLSTSTRLDVISGVPFQLGTWQHVVVVYDPVQLSNATLTIFINGVQANQTTWNGGTSGTAPGYGACTGDHNPAPNGQPALALGGYNNANSGTYGFSNPWIGGVDEFAFYSAKLTPAQILAHYQNGTNANRSQSYSSLIQSLNPAAYLRLDETAPGPDLAVNLGGLGRDAGGGTGGIAGLGTNTADVRHPAPGAVASDAKSGATAYHNRNGNSTTTIPYDPANNGKIPGSSVASAGTPFTFEAWLRPMRDNQGGQCPVNNRYVHSGHRTGWVVFQRNPNLSYPPSEGHGWDFRMYDGYDGSGQDLLTGDPTSPLGDYTIGKWQHLVVTWEPQLDQGDLGGYGNDTWLGTLTGYVDGQPVATNANIFYAANQSPTEDATPAADLAVGSYNAASTLGNNPFEGDVSDLAVYNNYVLTPDQILAHYQAGTKSSYGTNYATLVLTAAATPPIVERTTLPATYLRLNDPAGYPAANTGSLGSAAGGNLDLTTNTAAGPQAPAYAGFEASNTALPLNGVKQWASLNNPAGLEIASQITLEAWVQPAAAQGTTARIVSHGPQTLSGFLGKDLPGSVTNTSEVFLRIDGAGAHYSVGTARYDDGTATTTTTAASAVVPSGDLGGSAWVHLVGTYNGSAWSLYRNGVLVATQADATGALTVDNGDWAIGATGNGWADNFAGNVDEVAIYNKALTPAQVASHYVIGKAGTTAITITRASASNVTINYPVGTTLQQASVITGPYTQVGSASPPVYTTAATGTKFYRWSLP